MKPRSLASTLSRALAACLGAALILPAAPAGAGPVHRSAVAAAVAPAVTPGSYLTVVDRGPDAEYGGVNARSQRLVLISPTGETRTVYTRKVTRFNSMSLADWSADGSTALLVAPKRRGTELIGIDITTGATQVLDVRLFNSAILDPAGTGVIVSEWKSPKTNTMVLDRISWTGTVTRLRENVSGQMIAGRNGTVLTTDADRGRVQLLLSTSTGAVVNTFRGDRYCTAVRWWDATRVLEWCGAHADLYLVDPATGASERLTSGHGPGDYGHLDARYVGSRLYVQVAGACGYTFVARVTHGTTRHLQVPGAVGSVSMVNAVGKELVLAHLSSCDGDRPRAVLSLFDPVHHTEEPLLELGRHEAFGAIRVLGEVRASTF